MPWKLSTAQKPINRLEMKRRIMQYAHCTNYYYVGFAPMWQEKTKGVRKSLMRKVYKYKTN
jgi:hypothetical protein